MSNCRYDEVQDMNGDHFPIIEESMSHSPWEMAQYAGTPKTPENTLSGIWDKSSMAEWFVPCFACGKWNIPNTKYDLERMIGPWRPDISEAKPGLLCANPACRRPVSPRYGHWQHRKTENDWRWRFAGYHYPQPIMHIHYSSKDKWASLLNKREGAGNYTPDKFKNEVLGEPCGAGAQIISMDELVPACVLPWKNNPDDPNEKIFKRLDSYDHRILACDWGGGGKRTTKGGDPVSLTVMAAMGMRRDGTIEVFWGRRLFTPYDHLGEASEVLHWFKKFKCKHIVHDYTGAGSLRETFLIQTKKVSVRQVIPIRYVRTASADYMTRVAATEAHPRNHYNVDKVRSLQATCAGIRLRSIRFFEWDRIDSDRPGLVSDFLGLIDEKVDTRAGSPTYTISKHATLSDDFAQAVNIGAQYLWWITGRWPTVADMDRYAITEEFRKEADYNEEDGGWEREYGPRDPEE